MSHANVAIFIPHIGCPNQCSFCNQKNITGSCCSPSLGELSNTLNAVQLGMNEKFDGAEIAFFGGSFTAIDKEYMEALLKVAYPFVKSGKFSGIRVSTRPDAISPEILDILKVYGISAIELGAQSMDDEVLLANKRGHTKEDVIKASKLIKSYGFSLGLQMMTGLYKSDCRKDLDTGVALRDLLPDTMRIYPTVIMRGTELESLYKEGKYLTLSFEETIELCCKLLCMFEDAGIPVIRLGLHDSESLRENMIAGVYHPAFREICESKILYNKVVERLRLSNIQDGDIALTVNPKTVSKLVGQNKSNVKTLLKSFHSIKIHQNKNIKTGDFLIEKCGG